MKYVLAVVWLMTWSLTWCMRRYALAKQLLDIPNQRSAHVHPTPRGGGVAFVFVFIITMLCLIYSQKVVWFGDMFLMGALLITASVGFWDDKQSLPVHWRLLAQAIASGLALYGIGPIPGIVVFHWEISSGYGLTILALLYLIWMLNSYNFMDGIDGIASSEALFVCGGMGIIYWLTGYPMQMVVVLILAACMLGFLFWNFPPARIFMGDAGSGFLGLILGIFSLQSMAYNPSFIWSWLILLGVFIVDATLTITIRLIRKEHIAKAHNQHAYQHATRLFSSHLPVTLGACALNVVWLFPIALLVGLGRMNGFIGLMIAYLPLIVLAVQFKSGGVIE